MFSFLSLGFLLGLRHALDADHVAAVVSLATRGGSLRHQARQGALWGVGHTLTLLLVAGACLSLGIAVPEVAERGFEALVGGMLVLLGVSVLVRMRRRRIHLHRHRHEDGSDHVHAHGHEARIDHAEDAHEHTHTRPSLRALAVGAVHGLAGSAALVLLAAQTVRSPGAGLVYIGLFGIGSILGMMAIATLIAVPLRVSAKSRTGVFHALCGGAGAFSVLLGARILWNFVGGP
jgi:hypothetical protein